MGGPLWLIVFGGWVEETHAQNELGPNGMTRIGSLPIRAGLAHLVIFCSFYF